MIRQYQEKFKFTAVIVSHDIPDIFNIAQRIVMLDNGVILFEGTNEQLKASQNRTLNAFIQGEEVKESI